MEAFYLQRTRFELAGTRARRWDREFESAFLQQRVWNEPATAGKAQSCA